MKIPTSLLLALAEWPMALSLSATILTVSGDIVRRDGIDWHVPTWDDFGSSENYCGNFAIKSTTGVADPQLDDCQNLVNGLQSEGFILSLSNGWNGGEWINIVSYGTCNLYIDTEGFPDATASATVEVGTKDLIDILQNVITWAISLSSISVNGVGLDPISISEPTLASGSLPGTTGNMNCQMWDPSVSWRVQGSS
ncbi:hypothetical protein BGW36DRAFT_465094 [Talaromyces proteolyticus]|uniref:Ecp2 effector protein-like domain-containing protein n=1 Tax=Talaromyces proteolyticus TaxID=1131652 RepID=A0AAD4KIU2_9EURO|nr:uncharacterized protein BGW36DRAFT_465094 [Talaromyces proteolyticus]KAH8691323.1 hypothetical protein BGW36DRAFT_465094 [Talaromyces proteolyticus]